MIARLAAALRFAFAGPCASAVRVAAPVRCAAVAAAAVLALLVAPAARASDTASRPGVAAAPAAPVLFRHVHVVPMTSERVDADRDVLVVDGRIARIAPGGSVRPPRGATVVDGRGRWLLPGLAEMHAHVPSPAPGAAADPAQEAWARDVLLLYAAHGITTIRGMLGHPSHLALRERSARGDEFGPRLYTAGPSLNGTSAPDAATGERLVREQRAAGYDFLKLHPGLKRATFDAIVAAANAAGIPFEGHVAEDVGVERALAARQRAIDHFDGYVHALVDPACLGGPTSPGFFGIGLVHCVDDARIAPLVERTRAAGTWMAPTSILLEQWARPPSATELRARPALAWLPPPVLAQWERARDGFLGAQRADEARAERFVTLRRRLLRDLHAAGVPILLASDAPQVYNVPGDSALAELELYVASGLSPYEALRTGTVAPARYFGAGERRGTIEPGRDADLVLVAADPLADVRALRRREGVMLAGRWYDRAHLDARLADLARRNAASSKDRPTD